MTLGLMAYAGNMVWQALETRWSDEPQQRPARERVFAANVVTIQPETIRPVLTTFGEVRSRRTLLLRAASGGSVIWLSDKVEEGGSVDVGDVLVRIDPAEAQSALDTAQADLTEAEADLRDAERALGLAADEITGGREPVAASVQCAGTTARPAPTRRRDRPPLSKLRNLLCLPPIRPFCRAARLRRLQRRGLIRRKTALQRRQIALTEAERRLADTEIQAEFAGVLNNVSIVEGELVSSGQTLAELIDPKALELSFRLSTPQYTRFLNDSGRLEGAEVTASIDILGVDLEAKGRVSRESAAVAEGQTGRLLFARLETAPGFRPGDFVSVRIEEPPLERVARLPATAVDAGGTVLVVGEEERLEVGQVELLRREGDDVIVRARGLAGREIVAERTPLLGAGIKVRPIRPGNAEAPAEPELLALDPDRRAKLVAFVEANQFMPAEAKARVLGQLKEDKVPARIVERIESRMGG